MIIARNGRSKKQLVLFRQNILWWTHTRCELSYWQHKKNKNDIIVKCWLRVNFGARKLQRQCVIFSVNVIQYKEPAWKCNYFSLVSLQSFLHAYIQTKAENDYVQPGSVWLVCVQKKREFIKARLHFWPPCCKCELIGIQKVLGLFDTATWNLGRVEELEHI